MLFKNRMYSLLFVASQIMTVGSAHADIPLGFSGNAALSAQASYGLAGGGALAGSGYWAGTQACPYRTKTSKAAVDESDDVKAEKKAIAKLEAEVKLKTLEQDRAEKKLEILSKKLEKFFDASVSEFLISVHMDKMNKCEDYRSFPANNCPVPGKPGITAVSGDSSGEPVSKATIELCNGKDEVPDLLKDKWIKSDGTSGYCAANSNSSRGNISSGICSDKTLQPSDTPKYRKLSATECSRALSDYRKARIDYEKAQDLVERKKEEIEERTTALGDKQAMAKLERDYKMKSLEGGTDCEECDLAGRRYERPQRDWLSTVVNAVGGIGLIRYGQKIDESAQEYSAQLGIPSTNSYGYPFVTAGVYSVINGLAGPGAYGCAGGIGGSGFPYGAAGSLGALGINGYGPNAALGGAFGYPGSLYGSPWGGGAYLPGFGLNGNLNGPNGGWPFGLNGQVGIGAPLNGQIGIPANGGFQSTVACLTWPCNVGTAVGGALNGVANGQIGIPASGGWPTTGYMNNNGYMSNYQLQLLQQQQAMSQAQAQQQAQLAQYYQAQAQVQMQAYARQQQAQQEAVQVQQVISSLQARLNMIYSSAYGGGSYSGSGSLFGGGSLGTGYYGGLGGIVSGGIYFGAATNTTYPIGTATTLPGIGTATTTVLPGVGTGTRGGR